MLVMLGVIKARDGPYGLAENVERGLFDATDINNDLTTQTHTLDVHCTVKLIVSSPQD